MVGRFTKRGYVTLGEVTAEGLERLGWRQKDLANELSIRGRDTTEDEISRFINAYGAKPDGSLVLSLGRLNLLLLQEGKEFLIDKTGRPYTADDLFDIAMERFDPKTGERKDGFTQANQD